MPAKALVRLPRTASGAPAVMPSATCLTAETVIGALENAEDYQAFQAAIMADYDAQSAVERELVLRLASLLWRLRRATTIETACSKCRLTNSMSSSRSATFTRSDPKDLVVVSGKEAGNPLAIYYSRRKGWVFPPPPSDFDMEPSEAIHQLSEMSRRGARWFALAKDAHDSTNRKLKFADRYSEVISLLEREGPVIDGEDFKIYPLPATGP